jgi:hypothetical protein
MGKAKIEKMPWGVIVTLSDGDVTHLRAEDYGRLEDQIAWVSDCLGLSVDIPVVETVDGVLYDMTHLNISYRDWTNSVVFKNLTLTEAENRLIHLDKIEDETKINSPSDSGMTRRLYLEEAEYLRAAIKQFNDREWTV